MKTITFYNNIINPTIVNLQKKVFNHFGFDIDQINVTDWVSHGKSVDDYLKLITDPREIIVLFDIDAIPLNSTIIKDAVKWCSDNIGIYSVAQKAVNLKNPIIHAAPSFMVFSIETFNLLGRPTFTTNLRSDCGGEMTHSARDKGIEIRMLYPSNVETPHSQLDGPIMFGYGTTYGHQIYHSFESRFKSKDGYFINKCNSILKV